ncbi:MAG: hypothetical protein II349_06290 [Akkermansia sp.]|nr:hypothetical protein [Akkermansia sp.]
MPRTIPPRPAFCKHDFGHPAHRIGTPAMWQKTSQARPKASLTPSFIILASA